MKSGAIAFGLAVGFSAPCWAETSAPPAEWSNAHKLAVILEGQGCSMSRDEAEKVFSASHPGLDFETAEKALFDGCDSFRALGNTLLGLKNFGNCA
ncbi:hypothetical protein [Sulfitobacter sp. JB4-11]|uniref:hypothetical protein n=1 Tax=Sulfitobacter rhodophyticola TaxID=3238304 RepID=UPI003513C04D